jgi:hypothetical protein
MTTTHEINLSALFDLPSEPQDVAAARHLASDSYISLSTARSAHREDGGYVTVSERVATADRSRGSYVSGAIASAPSAGSYISR